MRTLSAMLRLLIGVAVLALAQDSASVEKAAVKYMTRVAWRRSSVVSGDFTCSGRTEQAILGFSESETVIAVFVKGLSGAP